MNWSAIFLLRRRIIKIQAKKINFWMVLKACNFSFLVFIGCKSSSPTSLNATTTYATSNQEEKFQNAPPLSLPSEETKVPEDLIQKAEPSVEAFPSMSELQIARFLPNLLIGKWQLSSRYLQFSYSDIPLFMELLPNQVYKLQSPKGWIEGAWQNQKNILMLQVSNSDSASLIFTVVYISDLYLVLQKTDFEKVLYLRQN
ncbi:MAG: hypothetical protein RML72_11490 [Bacteroidia bacterium]|nr:hypothetical protein [Bacteroidia bacterium]MDW8159479.1 hypothetical protein [Bacteroidia bacterium]